MLKERYHIMEDAMKRIVFTLTCLCAVVFLFSNSFSQIGGLDPVGVLNAQLKKYTIKFHLNEYTFTDPKYIKSMDEYAPLIKGVTEKIPGGYSLNVVGHASQDGSDAYNQELSEKRAQTVYDRLLKAGVAANIMKTVGKGEAQNKRAVTFEIKKD
jgi:outer membrane protein OmpA-like peptidoglycan-associated protein